MYSQPLGRLDLGLPLDHSFKIKLWWVNVKMSCLLVRCTVNLQDTIGCESFGGVRFDLELILQDQTMTGQHKSASTFRKPQLANVFQLTYLTLDLFLMVKLWWLNRSFKHKLVPTNIKLPLTCVLIVLLFCNIQPFCWKSKNADFMLLMSALRLCRPLHAVNTFVHLTTDANIVQFFMI